MSCTVRDLEIYNTSSTPKWMILGLLGQFFEPFEIEIFLKRCGPILGSKKTYLGSKIDIFGPIWPKKWKISWKDNKKMDDTRSPGPIFRAHQDRNIFKNAADLF